MATSVRTACNRDCPDACGIVATVEGGRIVRIAGDPDHPVTRGSLCLRTSRFLERQHDPQRLTTPLVRRAGHLEPATWEEALDLIAEKLLAVRAESGGAAVLHYRSGGSLGLLKHVTDLFFERFGPVTVKAGDICSGAGDAAQLADFGDEDSHDLFDLLHSRSILVWGKNPHVSGPHLLPVLQEARRRGAKLVLIDPVRHRGAETCGRHLQVRPGGDAALALGVLRVLFERGLTHEAAETWCDGLPELRQLALSRPLSAWAALADLPEAAAVEIAELLADRPAAILVGWGLGRRAHGSATVRLLDALGTVTGNVGIPGGGVSFYFKRRGAFDATFGVERVPPPRTILEPTLGRGILEAKDPPVRVAWVTAGNPVVMLPDSRTVERAFATREMTVVVDSFLTDTARAAHVVLPTTTMLEDDDLVGAYGHHWLSEVRPVVPPPPGVLTDLGIVQALAPRLGLGDEFAAPPETWKRRLLAGVEREGASLEDLREGPVRNPRAAHVLFEGRRFPTATGRANLITCVNPEPPRPTAARPFLLMAQSCLEGQGSQWSAASQAGPLVATVHPEAAPAFREGDLALVESEAGSLVVQLAFDASQRRDVLLAAKGGWLSAGRCANVLVPAVPTDAGGGAAYLDVPVSLRPLSPPAP